MKARFSPTVAGPQATLHSPAVGSAGAIAHYDGNSWRQVAHQKIGAPYLRLFLAVHGTSSSDVWAVGQQLGEGGSTSLIYHYQP